MKHEPGSQLLQSGKHFNKVDIKATKPVNHYSKK